MRQYRASLVYSPKCSICGYYQECSNPKSCEPQKAKRKARQERKKIIRNEIKDLKP